MLGITWPSPASLGSPRAQSRRPPKKRKAPRNEAPGAKQRYDIYLSLSACLVCLFGWLIACASGGCSCFLFPEALVVPEVVASGVWIMDPVLWPLRPGPRGRQEAETWLIMVVGQNL